MPPTEKDVADDLDSRQYADKALDRYGGLRPRYQQFHDELTRVYSVYANQWQMIWPDGLAENADPMVPNMVRIAADDRARAVAATVPSIVCYPDGPTDKAREKADKLERIIGGWFDNARIRGHKTRMWAYDAMGGLAICKVLPDFNAPSRQQRFPTFERLSPLLSYPEPVFTSGPFVNSFIYAYEVTRREVAAQYPNAPIEWPDQSKNRNEKMRLIEYYDDTWTMVIAEQVLSSPFSNAKPKRQTLVQEKHKMGKCPVVIAATPTMDGVYSGEFISGLGVQDYWNKLMTLMMDDAVRKTYAQKLVYNVLNSQDWGPDATLEAESPDARFEYIQNPNQPFTNLQVLRSAQDSTRTAFILPPSRSGDPNESIISAAGISASAGQFNEDVRAIQRDGLQPMFEAAIQLALAGEEAWDPNVKKAIWAAESGGYKETYVPSQDIDGYRRAKIRYGAASGLDEVNQNVMVLQQLGAGIIDERTAMEMSPFVEDPQRVEKRKLRKLLEDAMVQGLAAQAQQGTLDPMRLAMLTQAVESDEVTLAEAVAQLIPQAPLAAPAQTPPGAPPAAPGIAGAATGPQPQQTQAGQAQGMPDLASLLGTGQ